MIEQKEWELRKKQSLERCENLSQKKENLSREINDLVQLPDQMLENIKKFENFILKIPIFNNYKIIRSIDQLINKINKIIRSVVISLL